jgi:hypothetical protein
MFYAEALIQHEGNDIVAPVQLTLMRRSPKKTARLKLARRQIEGSWERTLSAGINAQTDLPVPLHLANGAIVGGIYFAMHIVS